MNFADVTLVNRVGQWVQEGLAILGAAVLGGVLLGLGLSFISRLVSGNPLPAKMTRFTRIFGGVATGITVGWILFNNAGKGGPGGDDTGGAGKSLITQGNVANTSPQDSSKPVNPPADPPKLSITVLGEGRVKDGALFVMEGHAKPMTLSEVQSALEIRPIPKDGTAQLTVWLYDDSVLASRAEVKQLEELGKQLGWVVLMRRESGVAPGVGP